MEQTVYKTDIILIIFQENMESQDYVEAYSKYKKYELNFFWANGAKDIIKYDVKKLESPGRGGQFLCNKNWLSTVSRWQVEHIMPHLTLLLEPLWEAGYK